MTEPHLPEARENAQRTYDRRRARKAADTLAVIPPNRWDDETRRIIGTLATISAPSRIDDVVEAAFPDDPSAAGFVALPDDALERIKAWAEVYSTDSTGIAVADDPRQRNPLADDYDPGPVPAAYDMPSPYDPPELQERMARDEQDAALRFRAVHDNGDCTRTDWCTVKGTHTVCSSMHDNGDYRA